MFQQNLHTHSVWDDGQNTQEEMVQAARKAGLKSLGFSIHSYLPLAEAWTLVPEKLPEYTRAVKSLQEKYAGEFPIYFGIEWDILSTADISLFDYVIGSIHQISINNEDYCVDESPAMTMEYLNKAFHGDADAAAEAYFAQYAALAKVKAVDIVGHFDIITKFDQVENCYDANSPRFLAAALAAMETLVKADKIFEINTGAISRGYRTTPYPSRALLAELKRMGGRITISSDSHSVDSVAFGFDAAEQLALDCGFREAWMFDGKTFVPVPLG